MRNSGVYIKLNDLMIVLNNTLLDNIECYCEPCMAENQSIRKLIAAIDRTPIDGSPSTYTSIPIHHMQPDGTLACIKPKHLLK